MEPTPAFARIVLGCCVRMWTNGAKRNVLGVDRPLRETRHWAWEGVAGWTAADVAVDWLIVVEVKGGLEVCAMRVCASLSVEEPMAAGDMIRIMPYAHFGRWYVGKGVEEWRS